MNRLVLKKHPLFVPVLWSLVFHFIGAIATMFIVLESANETTPREKLLNFKMRSVDTRSPVRTYQRGIPGAVPFAARLTPFKDVSTLSLPPGKEPKARTSPVERIQKKTTLDEALMNSERDLDTIVTHVEEKELKENIPVSRQSTENSGMMARMAERYKIDTQGIAAALKRPLKALFTGRSQNVDIDAEEGMPGFTPMQGSFGDSDLNQGPAESKGEIMKYETLDEFLDIEVYTYRDASDSKNYFMIKIFAKKDMKVFNVMPKEILFAVDCSLSIHPERLEQFKKGITYCLAHFNEGDVFNIISFKDTLSFFSSQSVPATPKNIRRAEKFVADLTASEQTDVYLAFRKIVDIPPARNPSNVILLSDGRPTRGVVDSRELINSVTRVNQKVRPVFAFSGGAKVNRYLLDFIAYQNRAWAQFMKKTWDIRRGLAEFYDKIRDPIFLNLRYRLNGLEEREVFPKSLPDFYRNAEFTLYGKFDKEDEFSMQLLGKAEGKTKELIFSRSLSQAPKGGPEIMKGYAFNKIYYLINQVTIHGKLPELLKQIDDLSRRYGITTPYSPELEKLD